MTDKLSTIRAIHARFEAAVAEYFKIDEFSGKLADDKSGNKFRLSSAMLESVDESDALRLAILYQVPDTWDEAKILAYHIHAAYDLIHNDEDRRRPATEREALSIAIDHLFDFIDCEVQADDDLGPNYRESAKLVFQARRLRTGVTDDFE